MVLLLAALAVLAIPFLRVPKEAEAAKQDLEEVVSALRAGDPKAAARASSGAREHVDAAQDATQGLGGDIWSRIPFVGSPVSDARHLTQAMDDVTSAVETAVDLYPSVAGRQATLVQGTQVDGDTLDDVVSGVEAMGEGLTSARAELDAVEGSFPVVGDTIASRRDEAADLVDPAAETFERARPVVDELPAMLGFEGKRSYLVAMLNPSELRYSGGAALAFAPLTFENGTITLGASKSVAANPALQQEASWRKVFGNKFHPREGRVSNATFAPSWSVSGEELLRAWKETNNKRHDGVVAIDVEALSGLLGTTGGAEVPGYGTLTADNLVSTLVGSYDQYYPDPNAQDDLNDQLIPVFRDLMFGGGSYLAKAQSLGEAADGRHFALYMRSDEVQEGVAALGLSGDLAPAVGDYLGVFSQNINGSKADYWQRRGLSLDVRLDADGTAHNRLAVKVFNDSPTYPFPVPDPQIGYFTRYLVTSVAAFLPPDITVSGQQTTGEPWEVEEDAYYDHSYARTRLSLDPQATGTASLDYRVPGAATEAEDGSLVYRLAVDPQGTVVPQSMRVQVQLPRGYEAGSLPEGWVATGRTVTFETQAFETTEEWEIRLRPTT